MTDRGKETLTERVKHVQNLAHHLLQLETAESSNEHNTNILLDMQRRLEGILILIDGLNEAEI